MLLPMAYAISLGGMCTLLGSSSNRIIKGLYDASFLDPPQVSQNSTAELDVFAPFLTAAPLVSHQPSKNLSRTSQLR
jgi:hypothetical protein